MTVFFLAAFGFVLLVWRLGKRRARRRALLSPLAGLDTGVRSPYRVPRGVHFHKGL